LGSLERSMYKKLGTIEFGKALLETEDLDPIYVMLWKTKMSDSRLKRWLLAYWFFYHAGVASKLSKYKGDEFFERAIEMARSEAKTPRGTERRHFRGKACKRSLRFFHREYRNPEEAITQLIYQIRNVKGDNTVGAVVDFVRRDWPLFGPWIGFKIADMLERLDIYPIRFPIETLEMYSEPVAGAILVERSFYGKYLDQPPHATDPEVEISKVVNNLIHKFRHYKAPPRYERPVGVQEVETILCKWKSHTNGHYPIGKDTREIREGLHGWGKLAKELRHNLPKEIVK